MFAYSVKISFHCHKSVRQMQILCGQDWRSLDFDRLGLSSEADLHSFKVNPFIQFILVVHRPSLFSYVGLPCFQNIKYCSLLTNVQIRFHKTQAIELQSYFPLSRPGESQVDLIIMKWLLSHLNWDYIKFSMQRTKCGVITCQQENTNLRWQAYFSSYVANNLVALKPYVHCIDQNINKRISRLSHVQSSNLYCNKNGRLEEHSRLAPHAEYFPADVVRCKVSCRRLER